jgi:hypothetical protein
VAFALDLPPNLKTGRWREGKADELEAAVTETDHASGRSIVRNAPQEGCQRVAGNLNSQNGYGVSGRDRFQGSELSTKKNLAAADVHGRSIVPIPDGQNGNPGFKR